jgi:hypothetical protein
MRQGRNKMLDLLLRMLKLAGIALLYSTAASLLCATVQRCLWLPFLHWDGGDNVQAAVRFANYYQTLVTIVTISVAFLAGRSYRPFRQIWGIATGASAALLFRSFERTQYPLGRGPDLTDTLLAASFLGVIFALLGSVSNWRAKTLISQERIGAE